jgi:hypothetical protein
MKELLRESVGEGEGIEDTHCIGSFWMRVVDSRNKVSVGGILWNTTEAIDDFPLLLQC